ncbi:enoyl-CoA hydratase/isomerase family protein [Saccharopolyspora spinosa]|uniref:Enoyl-CoA hydratase/carnithine racemase n=1 Tax=Saccharopolyspora spinosa TaxID=60894 RepID=A0A2N3Y197_SACSN|nr:enoyl-CoA hydratase/isomerase family protein [Saccharopolyspora spinosa]PKW16631.1 enoyl-CoA hydratase/carnithine racemase [Saccharopolyspora spinosa]
MATEIFDSNAPVQCEIDGQIGVVRLNRPTKLNAWDMSMRAELTERITGLAQDDACKAIVLAGTGGNFCAGQDLNETAAFAPDDPGVAEDWIASFDAIYAATRNSPKPVVAAVEGVAAGSGFQWVLLADIRVGHAATRMGQPEVLSGIPSITGVWAMWSVLGRAKVTEFALSGRLVNGEEALRLGLLNYVVEEGQVFEKAMSEARRLADLPGVAVRTTKDWIRRIEEAAYQEAVTWAKQVHRESNASGEPQQEMRRFLDGARR